jgi:ABC-type molybdate transport system ATPase subunit
VLELELDVQRDGFALNAQLSLARGPTALVGPNGAGKSTLLRAILGAVPVRRGRIVLDGHTLLDTARGVSVPTEERRVAWVPQEYALFRTSPSSRTSPSASPVRRGAPAPPR